MTIEDMLGNITNLVLFNSFRCNYSCYHCFNGSYLEQSRLTPYEMQSLMKSLKQKVITNPGKEYSITLTGGELLFNPSTRGINHSAFDLLSVSSEPVNGISPTVVLDTNGWWGNRHDAKEIMLNIMHSGTGVIFLSLDGIGNVHNQFRKVPERGEGYLAVLNILNTFSEMVPMLQNFPRFRYLHIGTVMHSEFLSQILEFESLMDAYDEKCTFVNHHYFFNSPFILYPRGNSASYLHPIDELLPIDAANKGIAAIQRLSPEKQGRYSSVMRHLTRRVTDPRYVGTFDDFVEEFLGCGIVDPSTGYCNSIKIMPNGDITLCYLQREGFASLGNAAQNLDGVLDHAEERLLLSLNTRSAASFKLSARTLQVADRHNRRIMDRFYYFRDDNQPWNFCEGCQIVTRFAHAVQKHHGDANAAYLETFNI